MHDQIRRAVLCEDYDMLYGMLTDPTDEGRYLSKRYADISINHGLHPDDDFEDILTILMEQLHEAN